MRILFLTPSPLTAYTGPLARLRGELSFLATDHQIGIVCLGAQADSEEARRAYPAVTFFHVALEFNGWSVLNIPYVLQSIDRFIDIFHADIVVLQMEIWDLMRELGQHLEGKIPFAAVLHAMPFLGAPLEVTGDFDRDVGAFLQTDLADYRKSYIRNHYLEARAVFQRMHVIANNKTVAWYFRSYFPDFLLHIQSPAIVSPLRADLPFLEKPSHDFAYMARIEAGKGIEYLEDILTQTALLLGRPVSLVLMGKIEDAKSKMVLNQLIAASAKRDLFTIDYRGWADESCKLSILPSCGVFLYPSQYDNYPTVVNEALCFGMPCVTWDIPYSRLNYMSTTAVSRVPFPQTRDFAHAAITALSRRKVLHREALRFVRSFDSPQEVASRDGELFSRIAHQNHGEAQ